MKKIIAKKLQLRKDTLALLSAGDLTKAAGAGFTDDEGCVDTVPRSFCICPTKHVCTINC
jgi:hypothetical protein